MSEARRGKNKDVTPFPLKESNTLTIYKYLNFLFRQESFASVSAVEREIDVTRPASTFKREIEK